MTAAKRKRGGGRNALAETLGTDADVERKRRVPAVSPAPLRGADDDDAFAAFATWQLIDPLLPTGGFAHSQGLEAAAHAGLVAGGDERLGRRGAEETGWDVVAFARECVANAASQSLPFVEAARRVFGALRERAEEPSPRGGKRNAFSEADGKADGDAVARAVDAFVALDRRLAARLVGNAAATRASAATGAALLRAAIAAFGRPPPETRTIAATAAEDDDEDAFFPEPLVEALRRAKAATRSEKRRETRLPGAHLAVVFGAVAGAAGFSARHAARIFCYLTLRDTLSAATRLNLVGPLAAGAAVRRCVASAEARAAEAVAACVRAADRAAAETPETLNPGGSSGRHAAGLTRAALLAMTSRAASSSPLVDIVHAGHDALFSRLFNS